MNASTAQRVSREQRYNRNFLCPICGGGENDKRGNGTRDWGFQSADGSYACCTSEAYAGALVLNPKTNAYHHRLNGPCPCGADHSDAPIPLPVSRGAERPKQSHLRETPTAIYPYSAGLRKLRYGHGKGKWFVWQHQDPAGAWWNCDGCTTHERPGLYRAGGLVAADPWEPVFITEGEGKADTIVSLGGVAVSPPDGAGSWRKEFAEHLRSRQVVILQDPDEPGRKCAQDIAASLAGEASTVRIVEVAHAGDVADWLADGHTLADLRRLAATTAIITAPSPSALNSNRAMQDAHRAEVQKTPCGNCDRERELRRIAEASLANLRREHAIESRLLAAPTDKLSAPAKLTMIALRREMRESTRARPRDEQGRMQIFRATVAARIGASEATAGATIRKLADTGLLSKNTVSRGFGDSEIFIGLGPLADQPEAIEEPPRANTWGGKRVKACPHCHSTDLAHTVTCRACGSVMQPHELEEIEVVEDTPAQDVTPPSFLPENLIVEQDQSLATNSGPCGPVEATAGESDPAPVSEIASEIVRLRPIPLRICGADQREFCEPDRDDPRICGRCRNPLVEAPAKTPSYAQTPIWMRRGVNINGAT